MCPIAFTVNIHSPDGNRVHFQKGSDVREDALADGHTLGTAKASESCVGRQVGSTDKSSAAQIGDAVRVVDVKDGSFHDRAGKIHSTAAIRIQLDVQRRQLAG